MLRTMYKLLGLLGDAKSLTRSPSAYGRRKARASAHRALAKTMRKNRSTRP